MNFVEKLRELMQIESLKYEFLGNTAGDYVFAAIAFFAFLVVFKLVQWVIMRRLKRLAEHTKTDIDDAFLKIIQTVKPPFYSFLAFYFALILFVSLNAFFSRAITVLLIVWVVYQVINALQVLIDYVVAKAMGGDDNDDAKVAAGLIGKIAKITLWVIGLLLILSNLGINVNSLIAGLGVGGIAIAFALQNILADLFSSFAIYFDKPFVVGDYIVVGDSKGTVERIGIKTTRLRSSQGEELVISNQELTSSRVQNFKNISERRVALDFGVLYETPTEKLREIPKIIKDIIESVDNTRLDRVHFAKFDDSALIFETIYFVKSSEYAVHMDAQQDINFKIKDEFEKRGIEMAYPTQTIYIAGGKND